jgi:hypothetical protein
MSSFAIFFRGSMPLRVLEISGNIRTVSEEEVLRGYSGKEKNNEKEYMAVSPGE